jgi:hypothetical protein
MNKKLLYIGGGVVFAGLIIGVRVIYINKRMDEIAVANFTPEAINLITNGNPQELEFTPSDTSSEEIEANMESLLASISDDELQQYLDENDYLDY